MVLGAHCDDAEIGAGGTIRSLLQGPPPTEIRWVVFSAAGPREQEARVSAAETVSAAAEQTIEFHAFRDGFFPYEGARIKETFERLKSSYQPDVILTHHRDDLHQDHRVIAELEQRERDAGYADLSTYLGFADRVRETKRRLLSFLVQAKDAGKHVVGYGAPGKGNTLLNYCGIREDFLDYTVDLNPHKQGTFTPGTRIPIHDPSRIFETRPDYVLILPWNLANEITQQMAAIREWGGRFVIPIPEVRVLD
jgi:hypothetical protein